MTSDAEPLSLWQKIRTLVIGGARSPQDPHVFHKLSLIAFFAWIGLGADGLSSSSYGPEEAFRALATHPNLALFVAIGTAITILVISASYSQIIELFPQGGGGYLVASKLLSPTAGMVSGCALIVDYVLTIALSIASGADAIFSFLPPEWIHFKLELAVAGVVILTLLNLRGVKESVVPLVPIFITFIVTHLFVIVYAFYQHAGNLPAVISDTAAQAHQVSSEIGVFGLFVLIMRAYSMGAGTYTGIEAVSNGLPILRDPKVVTGKRTMRYMAASLAITVLGLMAAYVFYGVAPEATRTLNAVLFDKMVVGWSDGYGKAFVLITLASEAALLFVAAQTGFLGGPRVLANLALDRWFPTKFMMLSDRLVTQNGVLLMGVASLILVLLTGGSVRFLVVLYSINVFITFCLSQLGMVRHWWQVRGQGPRWIHGIIINGVGLVLCSFILVSVAVIKFDEGGWITLLVTGTLVAVVAAIKRHYNRTMKMLARLDPLVDAATIGGEGLAVRTQTAPAFNRDASTAVLFVNGFNGLGLHTLFSAMRLFREGFKNFVFVQVGLIDAGVFKGAEEIERLREQVDNDVSRYVAYMNRHGFYSEAFTSIGTDVIEEVLKLAPKVLERFPNSVFFGGQLVFPEDSLITRWLHNYIVFTLQRRFYHRGIPFVVLPIRV
ncbi:MAG: APC family permease [bacterium]